MSDEILDTATYRNRAWPMTINNYSEQEWLDCLAYKVEYSVFAKEIGEKCGTPHIQGYMYFKSAKQFSVMKKAFPRAHFKVPKGTPEQNRQYIVGPYDKDGKHKDFNPDAVEKGVCPRQGERTDLENVREVIKSSGKMRDVVQVATSYQSVRMAEAILKYHEVGRKWKPKVMWFWGATGTGKTKEAMEILGDDCYTCLSTGKWFEGYDAHENVLIDDMRKDFMKFHELLRLLDRYQMRVECKGGSRQFVAKQIIITSCYHPKAMFDTREDINQLLRRIDEIRSFGQIKIDDYTDEELLQDGFNYHHAP